MQFLEKLFSYKTVKINGVAFVIKRLSPLDFLATEQWFPISNWLDAKLAYEIENDKTKIDTETETFKLRIKDLLLRAVIKVKYNGKEYNIKEYIDDIMTEPEVYNKLFILILQHTLKLKKKLI